MTSALPSGKRTHCVASKESEITPTELKAARHALGLSAEGFARLVRVESGRTVRRWESGERDIPGPVKVLVALMLKSASVRKMLFIG